MIPYIVLILAITGVIIGACVITLAKFGDSPSISKCYNSSYLYNASLDNCRMHNASGSLTPGTTIGWGKNFSREYYSIDRSMEGETTVAEQQPTVAIIAVMVIIISIIAGVFVYFKYF